MLHWTCQVTATMCCPGGVECNGLRRGIETEGRSSRQSKTALEAGIVGIGGYRFFLFCFFFMLLLE